ncbi:MAG: glycine--tRNA ligase [Candidatus Peribacteraceae bacterium]
MPAPDLDTLVSLCKRRGFIFPGSEIYGGLANTWDYGPLGAELKRKLKNHWWNTFVRSRTDMFGLDASILMNPRTWEASGHVGSFSDMISMCKFCNKMTRTDHWSGLVTQSEWFKSLSGLYQTRDTVTLADLKKWGEKEAKKLAPNLAIVRNPSVTISWLAEFLEKVSDLTSDDQMQVQTTLLHLVEYLATEQLKQTGLRKPCPYCGGELADAQPFNLLFKTHQGIIEGKGTEIYLRPETAQGIFVNFKNIVDTMRPRLPFGVGQIGKAFRNEITPGNFTFRTREFEQMEIEFFVDPTDTSDHFGAWQKAIWDWYKGLGINEKNMRIREHDKDELSHYSSKTVDIEYQFPWGFGELFGLAHRGDFDLSAHQKNSGQDLSYTDPDDQTRKFLPHVIEPSFGCDRTVLTVLLEAYTEEKVGDDTRTVMKFAPEIAPIDLAILPLSKKEHLVSKAQELYKKLIHETDLTIDFDVTGSIGKRYRRQDEIGTPKCITVDFGTLGEDAAQGEKDTVTIRDRDTLKQDRLPITNLQNQI